MHPPVLRHLLAAALAAGVRSAGAQTPAPQTPALPPSASDPFAGSWSGVLRAGPLPLRLALSVTRDPAGALAAVLTSVDQGNARLPATAAARGDSLVLTVPAAGVTYTGVLSPARDSLRGTFAQGGAQFPLAFGRGAAAPVTRPQDPVPPFPYRDEEVAVESAPGVRLAGTLSVPPGPGPFPAVVIVSGSGAQDRDGAVLGHRPYQVIADHLARRGVATLRYDDRGVARSTGRFAAATTADFAADAEAAVRFLRGRPEVARDRVGIVGHSEGGLVGPMVAARTRDVAFLVLLAGPGVRGDSVLLLQGAAVARAAGAPEPAVAHGAAVQRRLYTAVAPARDSADAVARYDAASAEIVAGLPEAARAATAAQLGAARAQGASAWLRYFLGYDPVPALRRVRVPVLALNGTRDVQVTAAENLAAIRAALTAGGNRDHTETALPGLNHLFQTARTGLPAEYAAIDETVSPGALDAISTWVNARFARPARAGAR
jgi:pimeloyl-ACP methyl ester carboxylesterase